MYVIYLYNNMYVYLKQTSDSVFLYFFPFLVVIFQNLFNLTNKKKMKMFLDAVYFFIVHAYTTRTKCDANVLAIWVLFKNHL